MKKYPQVTIVVLNFNGLEDTRICLSHLLKSTYRAIRIVVVDNGSRKDEAAILKREFKDKRLQIIRSSINKGFSGGNNMIMRRVKSEFIALINNDVKVRPGWLTPIMALMQKQPEVAVVQPKILWAYDTRFFDYAGATGGFIDFLGYPFTRGRIFSSLEPDRGQYNKQTNIFWSSGAAMVIRRKVLEKVGLLDETFFNYMEEIDLCYRILHKNYRIVYEPKSVVYHKVASTGARKSSKKRFFEHRNNLLLLVKNFPKRKLFYILPIRFILEIVSAVYYMAIMRFDYTWSVFGSLTSFFLLFPRYYSERKNGWITDDRAIHKLIYPKSIVWAYFIAGKKTFGEIARFAHWRIK